MPINALDLLHGIDDNAINLGGNFDLLAFKNLMNLQLTSLQNPNPPPFSRTTEQFLSVLRDFILLLTSIKNAPNGPNDFIDNTLVPEINEFITETQKSVTLDPKTSQRVNQQLCIARLREFLSQTKSKVTTEISHATTPEMAKPFLIQLNDHIKESLLFFTGHPKEVYCHPDSNIKFRYPEFYDASIKLGEIYHRYIEDQTYSPTLALASSEAYAHYVRYVVQDFLTPIFIGRITNAETEEEPLIHVIKQKLLPNNPITRGNRISLAQCYVLEIGLRATSLLERQNNLKNSKLFQYKEALKFTLFNNDFIAGVSYIEQTLKNRSLSQGSKQLKFFITDIYNVLQQLKALALNLPQLHNDVDTNPQAYAKAKTQSNFAINSRTFAKAKTQFYFYCLLNCFNTTIDRLIILNDAARFIDETGQMKDNMPLMTGISRNLIANPHYIAHETEFNALLEKLKIVSIPYSGTEIMTKFFTFNIADSSQREKRTLVETLEQGGAVKQITIKNN